MVWKSLGDYREADDPSVVGCVIGDRIGARRYPVRTFNYLVFVGVKLEGLPFLRRQSFVNCHWLRRF